MQACPLSQHWLFVVSFPSLVHSQCPEWGRVFLSVLGSEDDDCGHLPWGSQPSLEQRENSSAVGTGSSARLWAATLSVPPDGRPF